MEEKRESMEMIGFDFLLKMLGGDFGLGKNIKFFCDIVSGLIFCRNKKATRSGVWLLFIL